jgi:S1-C subfamily serine protease
VAVTNISDDIRTGLNLPKEVQGAVIADIDAESSAAKAGLRAKVT